MSSFSKESIEKAREYQLNEIKKLEFNACRCDECLKVLDIRKDEVRQHDVALAQIELRKSSLAQKKYS